MELPPANGSDVEGLLVASFNARVRVYRRFTEMPDDLSEQIYQARDAGVEKI